jgi:leishmanolysin-like peptidase
LHELHHILGFNTKAYDGGFWDRIANSNKELDDVLISEQSRFGNRVKTPKVVDWVKNHFDCQTVDGMPLENAVTTGASNSHWEKTIVGNEVVSFSFLIN